MKTKSFLGTGWGYPVTPGADAKIDYAAEEKKIQQSVLIILGTAKGERLMRPDFGSRLHEMVFSTIDASTKSRIAHYATEALVQWEPRIDVLAVDISDEQASQGKLLVNIEYKVRATNSIFNLVYPFYLAEGREEES
jgi:phage baseplate assembly protein W